MFAIRVRLSGAFSGGANLDLVRSSSEPWGQGLSKH